MNGLTEQESDRGGSEAPTTARGRDNLRRRREPHNEREDDADTEPTIRSPLRHGADRVLNRFARAQLASERRAAALQDRLDADEGLERRRGCPRPDVVSEMAPLPIRRLA